MPNLRNHVIHFLKPKSDYELDLFAAWAFGDDFQEFDQSIQFMQAWNLLHGDKLLLKPDGLLDEDVDKMVASYKEMLNNSGEIV